MEPQSSQLESAPPPDAIPYYRQLTPIKCAQRVISNLNRLQSRKGGRALDPGEIRLLASVRDFLVELRATRSRGLDWADTPEIPATIEARFDRLRSKRTSRNAYGGNGNGGSNGGGDGITNNDFQAPGNVENANELPQNMKNTPPTIAPHSEAGGVNSPSLEKVEKHNSRGQSEQDQIAHVQPAEDANQKKSQHDRGAEDQLDGVVTKDEPEHDRAEDLHQQYEEPPVKNENNEPEEQAEDGAEEIHQGHRQAPAERYEFQCPPS